MRKALLFFSLLLSFSFNSFTQTSYNFYVSPTGDDLNNGLSELNAFASLEQARDEIRSLSGNTEITVWLLDGDYYLQQPFELSALDSGSPTKKITYRAKNKHQAKLHLTQRIQLSDFSDVIDPALIDRMRPEAQGNIKILDLSSMGLSNIAIWPDYFPASNQNLIRIYGEEELLQLSQFPNDTMMKMKRVTQNEPGIFEYRSDRHKNWLDAIGNGLWFQGYWRVAWQFDAIRTASIDTIAGLVYQTTSIPLGIGDKYTRPEGNGMEPYKAVNLLEEIDLEGEWCVHFDTQTLFIWPPSGISEFQLLDDQETIIKAVNVSNTNFIDLDVSYSAGVGIKIENGNQNLIAGCNISKCIDDAVQIINGTNHSVQSNDMHHLGAGGVLLSGGDRYDLSPANHSAVNNHIYEFGQVKVIYAPAVYTPGRYQDNNVGMYVAHNEIHGTPHVAIEYCGNNNVFEYNNIYDICRVSNDMGAFYSYADWTSYGNVIRYNYLHDAPNAHGAYFDDGDSGDSVYYNIMHNIDVGTFIGGGHDNIVFGNLAVNCEKTVHIDNRGVSRGYDLTNTTLVNRVLSVDYQNPPWSSQYPSIVNILDPTYSQALPVGNSIDCNVALNCTQVVDIDATTAADWEVLLGTNYISSNTNLSDPSLVGIDEILAETAYNGETCILGDADWSSLGLYEDEYRSLIAPETSDVIQMKVLLQGAFNSSSQLMETALSNNFVLSSSQPFNQAPWNYTGDEMLNSFPINAVDWLLIEARDIVDPNIILERVAIVLRNDGILLSLQNGNLKEGVTFSNLVSSGSYYFVIRHRNHLDIVSANPLALNTNILHDFSNPITSYNGGTQLSEIAPSVYAIKAGDINGNGIISVSDFNKLQLQLGQINNYYASDLNFDGNNTVADFNLYRSNSSSIGVNIIRY